MDRERARSGAADRRRPPGAVGWERPSGWSPRGAALVGVHAVLLADERRLGELAVVALAATVPAVLAAVRLPVLRSQATGAAVLAPWAAVLLFRVDGVLPAPVAGLLLALLAAAAFALATARAGRPEEWVLAAGGGARRA